MGRLFLKVWVRIFVVRQKHRNFLQRQDQNCGILLRRVKLPLFSEIDYVDCKGQITSHKADSQPSDREVAKKFTLLQYFKKYLNAGTLDKDVKKKFNNICYVKQWAKTEQGIIFRLSNKILQVNYNDRSQLMLYTQHCVGVYSDVNSEKVFFELGGNE